MKLFALLLFVLSARADFELSDSLKEKILKQGVPQASLEKILDWMKGKYGSSFSQRVYSCKDKEPTNLRPCEKEARTYFFKDVKISEARYVVSIDYRAPSTEKRMYFIDLKTGLVEKNYVSHGKGSGELVASKFSNEPDSKMTSLGVYLVGERYVGNHGESLRMYGLEQSNDAAYERDIVMHGADYADPKFFEKINPKTKLPYGRLGVSQGCPAITYALMKKYLPLLENGGIVDHYYGNSGQ